MPERPIELFVAQTGTGSTACYGVRLTLDGASVAADRALSVEQSRAVRRLSDDFGRLFESGRRPEQTRAQMAAIGARLFALWLEPSWPSLSRGLRPGDTRLLVVVTDCAEVLNLPWELLQPDGAEPIGADGAWALRRLPFAGRSLDPAPAALPPGPLRVLHMVCAPQDRDELHFEREEELMLRALGEAGGVVFQSGDLGTFAELGERLAAFRPHIVHLTGHGLAGSDTARLCFEDEGGRTDARATAELGRLFAGSGVQCAFLSACQAAKAPSEGALGGLAQGLVAQGVPLVVGWAASILDDVAITVAAAFYRAVADGRTSVDSALVAARQAARALCEARNDPSWPLPVLYAGSRQDLVVDAARSEGAADGSLSRHTLPGMAEGHAEPFVGRRRALQALLPGLRTGPIRAVLLTGPGGVGKSALATRLVRKLELDGFTPLALPSGERAPPDAGRLLAALADAFRDAGQREACDRLRAVEVPVAERLRAAVTELNRGRFVLLLDGLDSQLDEGSRAIRDAELAGFYRHLLGHLAGGARLVVTSRVGPSDVETLPPDAIERSLGELGEAAFFKLLLGDPAVERRHRAGALPYALLTRLHRDLGAAPRLLVQIRAVLAAMSADELAGELDRMALPGAATPGRLQAVRDAYWASLALGCLYERLSEASRRRLCRAAVYGLPVTVEALAALTGEPEAAVAESARAWRDLALAHVEQADGRALWSVHGVLRGWLLAPARLDPEAKRAAHAAAGAYLVGLGEHDRAGELGLDRVQTLLEARAQFLAAGTLREARAVTDTIGRVYFHEGRYAALAQLHEELLARETHQDTLTWLGRAAWSRARYAEARDYYERSLHIRREIGDRAGEAVTLHNLCSIDMNEGAHASARARFEQTLAVMREIGDEPGKAAAFHQLGSLDLREGAYAKARTRFEQALLIRRRIGDRAGEAVVLNNLATIDLDEGAPGAARARLMQALAILQPIADRAGEATVLHGLAAIDVTQGAYAQARTWFERVLTIRQEIGDRAGEAATWNELAGLDVREGTFAPARPVFERALAIRQEIGDRAGEAASLHGLASVDLSEGAFTSARALFERVLAIRTAIGDRAGSASVLHQLGSIDLNEGALDMARARFDTASAMNRQIGDRLGELAALHALASLDLKKGDIGAARKRFGEVLAASRGIGDRAGEANALHQLASLDVKDGAHAAARTRFREALAIRQAIGDRAGEAAALYELAGSDLDDGDFAAAGSGFRRALPIWQEIRDQRGEAYTWFQLGVLADRIGKPVEGMRMRATSFIIGRDIGLGDAVDDFQAVVAAARRLGLSDEQIVPMLHETAAAYRGDGGSALLAQAFPHADALPGAEPAPSA